MKRHFIRKVAKVANFTREDTEIIVNEFINQIKLYCKDMPAGESFTIAGFLSFKAKNRKPRQVMNRGELCDVLAAKVIKARATKAFTRFVNPGVEFDDAIEDEDDFDEGIE